MNKARRHEIKMLKYKKRLNALGLKEGPKKNLYAYRSHGKPCSCYACQQPESNYNRAKELDALRKRRIRSCGLDASRIFLNMKPLFTILFISLACASHAQIIRGTNLTVGNTTITGFLNSADGFKLAKDKVPTMFLLDQMFKENTTTLYKGIGLSGLATINDPLRVNVDSLFYHARTDDVKYWRKINGMWFWSKDGDGWIFWKGSTLMKVLAVPVDAPATSPKENAMEARLKALEAKVKKLERNKK